MTSSGTLVEFDRTTGLIKTRTIKNEQGEEEEVNLYEHSGVKSQFKRQAACFDFTTGKMYWNGFVNDGMGYNDWGSYGPLPDKKWRKNRKYDTALYEVDVQTGKATLISGIENRASLACMWMPGRDGSLLTTGIGTTVGSKTQAVKAYDAQGMLVFSGKARDMKLKSGMYIVNNGNGCKKIFVK